MVEKPQTSDRQYYLFALKIMGDFGVAIAVPVIVMVMLGQWLDNKYSFTPVFTVFGFVIAALLSVNRIYKKAKIYGEMYRKMDEKIDKNNK